VTVTHWTLDTGQWSVSVPGDEWRPGVRHDSLLRVNVFLLSRVDDVFLLKALERERPTPVTQQRNLHKHITSTSAVVI